MIYKTDIDLYNYYYSVELLITFLTLQEFRTLRPLIKIQKFTSCSLSEQLRDY